MSDTAYTIERFGRDREPVVIIDDFSPDYDALLRQSDAVSYGPAGRHYPGVRATAPAQYLQCQAQLLGHVLNDIFGFKKGADLIECNFSKVTTPAEALTPIQRLPHFDGADDRKLALLHYFCDAPFGGTSFYRHCATGFETISAGRLTAYDSKLRAEFSEFGPPSPAYFTDSTRQFERIGNVPARPNRLIIYRGIALHSGEILQPPYLGQDLKTARLTLNTFLSAR